MWKDSEHFGKYLQRLRLQLETKVESRLGVAWVCLQLETTVAAPAREWVLAYLVAIAAGIGHNTSNSAHQIRV